MDIFKIVNSIKDQNFDEKMVENPLADLELEFEEEKIDHSYKDKH